MPLAHNGLVKLAEECGELTQISAKIIAYPNTDIHPDGGISLRERLQNEIADVRAACCTVEKLFKLNSRAMDRREGVKQALFEKWANEV